MTLDSPLSELRGVGPSVERKLNSISVKTVGDLINYYPRRYDDYSHLTPISQIKPGVVTIQAIITQAKGRYSHRGLHITEAIAQDETGSVRLVWFNQPYRTAGLRQGVSYYVSGVFELSHQRFAIMNPSVELVSDFPVNTARIVPIYGETKGLKSSQIRRLVREISPLIDVLPETLPSWLIKGLRLIERHQAVRAMHFPDSSAQLTLAKRRLGFEEVFCLSLASLINKQAIKSETALIIPFKEGLARDFVSHLPFKLTDAQRKAVWRIYLDMQRKQPMNRLIEGDVGSGKTVVATMAALMAMEQQFQVAFMAPTELLARQHAETIHHLLEPLGFSDQVGLLIGSLKPADKQDIQRRIKAGSVRLMIGTHALIAEKVDMHCLGLIIIDEQHRFGVDQRRALQAKAGHVPHVLSLTATPIPRSLALTLYGELDISVIETKPTNRKPIITKLIPPAAQPDVYKKIAIELDKGRQAFFVTPLIAESDLINAKSAEKVYEELKMGPFKKYKLGLLHGRLKSDNKNEVMAKFIKGEIDILVTTTVIEVGVDVPNATVMLIEAAERFGLAQIHQLRGRVGRSSHQGYAYLILSDNQPPGRRLRALESTDDGFKLAELDLEIRGPGAIYGTLQHGQLDLRIANLTDMKLITEARQSAQDFIDKNESLLKYKQLHKQVTHLQAVTYLN